MASNSRFLLVAATAAAFGLLQLIHCLEFDVGERAGWAVPPPNATDFYNKWASKKRFKVDDTIRFKYKKDSVMEVSKRDYKDCTSNRPILYSNTGNTVYGLNRSGFFYFISGSAGHCKLGQRMIVWVVGQDSPGEYLCASDSNTLNNALFPYGFLLIIILVFHFFSL